MVSELLVRHGRALDDSFHVVLPTAIGSEVNHSPEPQPRTPPKQQSAASVLFLTHCSASMVLAYRYGSEKISIGVYPYVTYTLDSDWK